MPNRIIKESTFTSDKIAELSDFEFRLWIGLITQADDVGRGDARPKIIKGRVFSLRDRVTVTDIDKALQRLAATGCVSLYTVGGKPYYEFPNWAEHQRIRNVQPKYPGMDEADNLRQSAAICGEMRLESESESESESNTNPNVCTEQAPLASVPPLPLNNGEEYSVTVANLDEWKKLYPAVDVEQELRNMRGWLIANKSRRKTPSGIERFIVNWLSSEQNKGHKKPQTSQTPASYDIDRAEQKMNKMPKLKKKENLHD